MEDYMTQERFFQKWKTIQRLNHCVINGELLTIRTEGLEKQWPSVYFSYETMSEGNVKGFERKMEQNIFHFSQPSFLAVTQNC